MVQPADNAPHDTPHFTSHPLSLILHTLDSEAFPLFLHNNTHSPTSGPLHMQFPLPGKPFP